MALRDPLVTEAQNALLEHLAEDAVGQVVGGGERSPHDGTALHEPRREHGPPAPRAPAPAPAARPDVPALLC
jgi:hypothetical protein